MSEITNEKQIGFLGTYFDRDAILRICRWAEIIAWVTLTIYLLNWLISVLLFFAQYYNGMFFDKGMTFLNVLNIFSPYLTQPLPGVFYFFGLMAVSKVLLILLDMEDNTRRAARK
jgi:hypothetical protein